jgi:hypothetical protein
MRDAAESLPSDLAAAYAMILAERHARLKAEANAAVAEANAAVAKAEAANAQADLSSSEALIAHLKLAIEKLRRELLWDAFGAHGAAAGSDGASTRRSGSGSDRGRVGGRECGGLDPDGQIVRAQAACAQAVSRSSAPRARGDGRAGELSLLRVGEAVQA